jgi:endonuclease-3
MEALTALPGVGRKTANVVLGDCFGVQGVVVDTHCTRLANRMGFTRNEDPIKIERDLMKIWPEDRWSLFSHLMVFHGRAVCAARAPRCSECPLCGLCPFPNTPEGKKLAR